MMEMPVEITPRTALSNFVRVRCEFFGQFRRSVQTKIRPSSIIIRFGLITLAKLHFLAAVKCKNRLKHLPISTNILVGIFLYQFWQAQQLFKIRSPFKDRPLLRIVSLSPGLYLNLDHYSSGFYTDIYIIYIYICKCIHIDTMVWQIPHKYHLYILSIMLVSILVSVSTPVDENVSIPSLLGKYLNSFMI